MSSPRSGADGVTEPDVLVAGLLHDAGKGDTGVWPRVAYSLASAVRRLGPRDGRMAARLRTRAGAAANPRGHVRRAGGGRRLLAPDRGADPRPGRPDRSGVRRAAASRGRGQLMAGDGSPGDPGHGADRRRRRSWPPRWPPPRRRSASVRVAGRSTGRRSRCPSSTDPLALLLSLIEARQLDVLTVPLGALADAYLDALGRLEADRLGNVSSFVTIASQLILIKSRAMLPRRTDPTDPLALADEGVDPEAELRARLLIYRAHRDAGLRLAEDALAPDRLVPAGALGGARGRAGRGTTGRCAAARSAPSCPGAGPAGGHRRADRATARDHGPHDHASPNAPRSSGPPCATPRGSSSRTS